jgi:hypothetical protein
VKSSGFSAAEKSAVTSACHHLIDDFLKPRFLPTIRPTQFNYPVDIHRRLGYLAMLSGRLRNMRALSVFQQTAS